MISHVTALLRRRFGANHASPMKVWSAPRATRKLALTANTVWGTTCIPTESSVWRTINGNPATRFLVYIRSYHCLHRYTSSSLFLERSISCGIRPRDYKWRFKGRIPHLPRAYGWVVWMHEGRSTRSSSAYRRYWEIHLYYQGTDAMHLHSSDAKAAAAL